MMTVSACVASVRADGSILVCGDRGEDLGLAAALVVGEGEWTGLVDIMGAWPVITCCGCGAYGG